MEGKEMSKETEIQNKPPEGKNKLGGLTGKLGKTVLAASMLTGIGAPATANSEDESVCQVNVELNSPEAAKASAERLKARIKEIGDDPLTFQESAELIPVIADFYVNNINTDLSPEVITQSSYVISGENTDEDRQFYQDNAMQLLFMNGIAVDFSNAPIYKRIKADYPDLEINNQINTSSIASIYKIRFQNEFILRTTKVGEVLGMSKKSAVDSYGLTTGVDNNIFIFLNSTNYTDNPQLTDLDTKECTASNPTAAFITAVVHETFHNDSKIATGDILQTSLDGSLKDNIKPLLKSNFDIGEMHKSGFAFSVSKTDEPLIFEEYHGLDEFAVHYMTTQILVENGIPTLIVNDRSPQAISNFSHILEQAGISLQELKHMHSNSKLEDFLVRIAEGSEGMKFDTRAEMIKFGFELFSNLFRQEKNWQDRFADYYELDLKDYDEKPFSDGLIYDGCGVPVLDNDFTTVSSTE